jgi:spermidine synthase
LWVFEFLSLLGLGLALWALYVGSGPLVLGQLKIHGGLLFFGVLLWGIGAICAKLVRHRCPQPSVFSGLWRLLSGKDPDVAKAPLQTETEAETKDATEVKTTPQEKVADKGLFEAAAFKPEVEDEPMATLRARWPLWLGMSAVSMAIMLIELLVTRIFSVTLRYHFAFMAISLALLGLGTAGILVYLLAPRFTADRFHHQQPWLAVGAALATVLGVITLLNVEIKLAYTPANFINLVRIYLAAFVPFLLDGLMVTLAFTHRSHHVGKLYFFDLIGAAAAGPVLLLLANWLGAPSAVLAAGGLVALGGWAFARSGRYRRGQKVALAVAVMLGLAALANTATGFLGVRFAKGKVQEKVLFSKWNSFSRVAVYDKNHEVWGLSPRYRGQIPPSLWLDIDASASTPILNLENRDPENIPHLRWVVTAYGYKLRPGGRALVIGAGGGRDILSALNHGFRHVDGVEINPIIVEDVMLGRFKRYTNALYEHPKVSVYVDDGRSFVRRSQKRYDVIQLSLVDTWAATSAGAYILSENNLYTVESMVDYITHLKPAGVLSIARWHRGGLRTLSLFTEACRRLKLGDPAARVMVFGHRNLVQLLLKKTPFTSGEVEQLRRLARRQAFRIYYAPPVAANPRQYHTSYARLLGDPEAFIARARLDLSPVTDDRPFFFNFTRLKDVPKRLRESRFLFGDGLSNLLSILIITCIMVVICIVLPLAVAFWRKRTSQPASAPTPPAEQKRYAGRMLLYFCALGFGYIVVEIVLMQKLTLLLGHPTTSLVVSLCGILLGSGLGAAVISRSNRARTVFFGRLALLSIIGGVLILRWVLDPLVTAVISASIVPRVLTAFSAVLAIGFVMGMPLPLGIRILDRHPADHALIPWAWGLNGALSVLGSGGAIFLAMYFGFNRTLLTGGGAYVIGLVVFLSLQDGRTTAHRTS